MAQDLISVVRNSNPITWSPKTFTVEPGTTIGDTAKVCPGEVVICRLNGVYISRKDWHHPLLLGDVVEWQDVSEGNALRAVLQIAATIIVAYLTAGQSLWIQIGAQLAVSLAINALLPAESQENKAQEKADSIYSTSASGNTATLNGPITRVCGRHQLFPRFAGQPYTQFVPSPSLVDRQDQFYYALFAVGYGNHIIERQLIDDTPLSSFQDVRIARYLPPGTQPTAVLGNVITCPEVSNAELKGTSAAALTPVDIIAGVPSPGAPDTSSLNFAVGGFAACGPLDKAIALGFDIIAPEGLWADHHPTWKIEIREIDQFGIPLTTWEVLAIESYSVTRNTSTPQRRSYKYPLSRPIRPEVRVQRTNAQDEAPGVADKIVWNSLRAYLEKPAILNAHTAHYELVMRASDQLSQLTQRKISLIVKAKVRTWDPYVGWGAEVHTRNPAWWIADLWTNPVWGEGLPDARVDLMTLYELSLIWDTRKDHLDYVFDTTTDAWAAAQLLCRAGRARPFRRGGVYTLARDALADLPVTAFTPRNTIINTMTSAETLPTRETPDGLILEYYDFRQWDWLPIECPCPNVLSMQHPVTLRVPGITGPTHALREGLYEAAQMLYRTRTVQCTTEMEGMLPSVMAPVRWQPETVEFGKTGDVAGWDVGTLTVTLSEPITFAVDTNYIQFIRDDGTLTDEVAVSEGANSYEVVLPEEPDFDLIFENPDREPTKFLFGTGISISQLVRISGITDGGRTAEGAQLYKIEAVVDDDRVHAVDNALVGVDDPITGSTLDSTFLATYLSNNIASYSSTTGAVAPPYTVGFTLTDEGLAFNYLNGLFYIRAGQWLVDGPYTPTETELFEVRATFVSGSTLYGGKLDTWSNMGVLNDWVLRSSDMGITETTLTIEIRDVATRTLQSSATVTLRIEILDTPADFGGVHEGDGDDAGGSGDESGVGGDEAGSDGADY